MEESRATIVVKESDVSTPYARRVEPAPVPQRVGVAAFVLRALLGLVVLVLAIPLVALGLACVVIAVPVIVIARMLRGKAKAQ